MKTSTASLASILICMIAVSSSSPSSHHGALSSHQKYYDTRINGQTADEDKNAEIACISPNTNIYEIFYKAQKEAGGNDMKCHFYLHKREKYEYIGTLDINKKLFEQLLTEYDHWLLTEIDTNKNVHKDERDKIHNAEGDDKNNNHQHKSHHTKDSHHRKQYNDVKIKYKNNKYIELDPRYNDTYKYFEVFLPKTKYKNYPRKIYINVDEGNKEFLLFDNEKHREMNYKPIKIGLRELSAIADVMFSKTEPGKNVFTVNDENSEDTEKYDINDVDSETFDEEEDITEGNSFDVEANTTLADITHYENDTKENYYTDLNETDIDEHNNIEYDNTTDYLDLNNTDINAYDDSVNLEYGDENDSINFNDTDINDTINFNDTENNETESYDDYDELPISDNNEDFDNDTLTKLEDIDYTDKVSVADDKNDISNGELIEASSEDAEQQEHVLEEDFRRSQLDKNGLQAPGNFAPVQEYGPRFDPACIKQLLLSNPAKVLNVQSLLEKPLPMPTTLDIPSNIDFDPCMKPIVIALPDSNPCNLVKTPCNYPLEELILPNDLSKTIATELSPKEIWNALPNSPCLVPLSSTINMPIQNDGKHRTVPFNSMNLPPYKLGNVLNHQKQIPTKIDASNPATAPIKNGVWESVPNLNNYANYNPLVCNPFLQSLPWKSLKELYATPCLNNNILSNPRLNPFQARPISSLNYPYINLNFPPNALSYQQKRPCLPFGYKDQYPSKLLSTNGINIPLPNKVLETVKNFNPFNIHLSSDEDMTIDPSKYGYLTEMPFAKFPNTPTKPCMPSLKLPANKNQLFDSSEHSRLESTLKEPKLQFLSSVEDDNRNFLDKSTVSSPAENSNSDSSLIGPHLDLDNSSLLSNSDNFKSVNVLSETDLESLIKFLSQSGYVINGLGKKELVAPETLDLSLIGSGLDLNKPSGTLTNSNVPSSSPLDSSLVGSGLGLDKSPLDSSLIGPNFELNESSGNLLSNILDSSNVSPVNLNEINTLAKLDLHKLYPLDPSLLGQSLILDKSGTLKPLDSSYVGLNFDSNVVTGPYPNSNILPINLNVINTAGNIEPIALPLDSTLIGPELNLNKLSGNLMSTTLVSSNVLPTDLNQINTSALNPLDSSLIGPELNTEDRPLVLTTQNDILRPLPVKEEMQFSTQNEFLSSTLDRSLLGHSLEIVSSKPTLENRAQIMNETHIIVHNDNDSNNPNKIEDNVPELLQDNMPLEDTPKTINVDLPNSFDTNATSIEDISQSELPEGTIDSNKNLVDELPLEGDESNTISDSNETQIENPINIVNTEDELTNNLNDTNHTVITPEATELDLNSTTESVESYDKFENVEPKDKSKNLEEVIIDSGLHEEINTSVNEEEVTDTNIEPVLDSNILENEITLEPDKYIKLIDVSNTTDNDAKLEENPEDYVILYTTNIKDGNLLTQTVTSDLSTPAEEINVTEKLPATNATKLLEGETEKVIEATNPIKDQHLDQANDSEVIFNEPDDSKNVLIQESRITIPHDEITVLDRSLLGPSLDISKEMSLNLIGGKVDSSLIGPSLLQDMVSTKNLPDVSGNNILDRFHTRPDLVQDNHIEVSLSLSFDSNQDSFLLGPNLNQDTDVNLVNNREGDQFNLAANANLANNIVADHSLVGPNFPAEEYTPILVDNPLKYFENLNNLQHAITPILNSANTIDSSLTGSDMLTLSKNAEESLDLKESPEFIMSSSTPIDSFTTKNGYNFNSEFDQSIPYAPIEYVPSTVGVTLPFRYTAPSVRPICVSPTPELPSVSSSVIPYCKSLPTSYSLPSHSNLLPCARNDYPPLFLPAPNPYKTAILPNQNFPGTIPDTFLSNSLPSVCFNSITTDITLPSVSGSRPLAPMTEIPCYKPVSTLSPFSITPQSPSSLVKPYPTSTLPSKSVLKGNSFPILKPFSNSFSSSDFVAPKLPDTITHPIPTKSPSTYAAKPCITNGNTLSSVPFISPTTFNSKPSLDLHTLTLNNILNNSPSLPDEQALYYLPQILSFLDKEQPSIQSTKLPNSPIQTSYPWYISKLSSNFQNPLSLPPDNIKSPKELKPQFSSPISPSLISSFTQMDSPVNKWAIPFSTTPVQNVATSISSSVTPELSNSLTQIPQNKPIFQIPSNIPINVPLSEWTALTPKEYVPTLSTSKVSTPSFKPESEIIDSEKETLLFNEIMSLFENQNFDLSRDAHISSTLSPNTYNIPTTILNSIPLQTEFQIQPAPLASMSQIVQPLSVNSINFNDKAKSSAPLSYFDSVLDSSLLDAMPLNIDNTINQIPNLQFKEVNNDLIVDKETINEIERLLDRDKQSRSIPHFDANVVSELKGPMYSEIPMYSSNFEPYVIENENEISMTSPVSFDKSIFEANALGSPNTIYNLSPDYKLYTIDDKTPISMPSTMSYARPSMGVNNINSPIPIHNLTPSIYEPYTVNDKILTPISAVPVNQPNEAAYIKFPSVNSLLPFNAPIKPLISNFPTKSSSFSPTQPFSSEYSPYSRLIETKLASMRPLNKVASIESTSVPLTDTSLVKNEYSSISDNIKTFSTESLKLPNAQLTSLNLVKSQTEPINPTNEIEATLPEVDSFKWSDIDFKGFEPYEEDTETKLVQTEDNDEEYDNRLVYSNDLFDKYHERPFIIEPEELNYIQEEKDLRPYASLNRNAFNEAVSTEPFSSSVEVTPQNTFTSLPIDTIAPTLKYASPITTLSTPLLKPLSLAPIPTYKSTLDKVNPFNTPICENVLSSPLSPSSSSPYMPANLMKPIQNTAFSPYTASPSSLSSLNIVSLPTESFNSYLPKVSSQISPLSKSFSNSPVSLTSSLPKDLQYIVTKKPSQSLPLSINPVPSSIPNTFETIPFIPSSQLKKYPTVDKPCTPIESKPYVLVNKASYPSPSVTPCTVLPLPCDISLSSSPTVYKSPKLPSSLPDITPITTVPDISLLNIDHTPYTPSYATKTLPNPAVTSNDTPFHSKPLLTSSINPCTSQMLSKPVYSPSAPSLSPVVQIFDAPPDSHLTFSKSPSKTTPIGQNIQSLPIQNSKPETIINYLPKPCKINTDLNILSPKEYVPFGLEYPVKITMPVLKNPFISSSVSPMETSPPLRLSNVLNPFIGSGNPNPCTSTVQIPPLISSTPSSYPFTSPYITEVRTEAVPISEPIKYNLQNLTFSSNIPILSTLSSKYSPLKNPIPSQPASSELLGNAQPFEVSPLPFTPPPLSSYSLIKTPSTKPYQSPYIPINLPTNILANTTPISPKSTPVSIPYTPTFEPVTSSNQYPCISINIPEYSPITPMVNTPINITPISSKPLQISTLVSKPPMPIFEPTMAPFIQTYTPTQTLPSTISQSNKKPSYLTPTYLKSPRFPSTPNPLKSPTVSHIPPPCIPLFSNLISPLAGKPVIYSQSKQLPIKNTPYKTVASPYMQETQKLTPTLFQPLKPVSSAAKSSMIPSFSYQPLTPIPNSPTKPINLPQSQSSTNPSDLPINTAYNLPTPKSFLIPQRYRGLIQTPTPATASNSQPCLQPTELNKEINPISPVEILLPKSRLQENEDLINLGDINNLPNALGSYIPYDLEQEMTEPEEDLKPKEGKFDNENTYAEEESLYGTTEEFDDYPNDEHLEDNVLYASEDTPTFGAQYLIKNNYIQREPIETQDNNDRINTLDLATQPMEWYNPITEPKDLNVQENNTKTSDYEIDDLTPETSNISPTIDNKNANDYYKDPLIMNLKSNSQFNLDNLDFKPPKAIDFEEIPNVDNIKYSGYNSYPMPLTNLRNAESIICNPAYTSMDSNSALNYNPKNMYIPIPNSIIQPEINLNNFNLSPNSLDLTKDSLHQPKMNFNNIDLSPKSFNLVTDTKDLKDSLIKYINKNDISKLNDELTIPIGNIAITDNTPIINNIDDTKIPGLNLKMWKSNVKIVNAEIKLKCKEINFNNFLPITMKDSKENYANVIKKYIEDTYGHCIVMDRPYSQDNRHSVLSRFEPSSLGNNFNLLWPS